MSITSNMHYTTLVSCLLHQAIVSAYLPSCTIQRSSLAFVTPRHEVYASTSAKSPIHRHRTPTHLFAKSDDIRNIYEKVKQEDSEWYNNLAKLLGEDAAADLDADGDRQETNANETNAGNDTVAINKEGDISSQNGTADTLIQANDESALEDKVKKDELPTKLEQSNLGRTAMHQTEEVDSQSRIDKNDNTDLEDATVAKTKESSSRKEGTGQQQEQPTPPSMSQKVQLRNKFTNEIESVAPLSFFNKRGYSQKEVLSLRPPVLELIVEDDIVKPRRGVPDLWVRDLYEDSNENDDDWVVEVVDTADVSVRQAEDYISNEAVPEMGDTKKPELQSTDDFVSETWGPFSSSRVAVDQEKKASPTVNDELPKNKQPADESMGKTDRRSSEAQQRRPVDDGPPRRRDGRSSPQSRQSYYDEEERPRSRRPRRQSSAEQRRSRPRRRELVIDSGDDNDDPPPNKFWMDLPTFRDFLRTEARLRLKILGPDWKESVMDESRWRFDLYKRWLYLLNDGVGENPLYTYGDRPAPRRARPSRRERESDASMRQPPQNRRRRSNRDRRRQSDEYYATDNEVMRDSSQRARRYERDNDREYARNSPIPRDEDDTRGNDQIEQRYSKVDDESDDNVKDERMKPHVDSRRAAAESREPKDGELDRNYEDPRRKQREEQQSQRPRRRQTSTDAPSRKRQPEWKDFSDLEDQLMNGSRQGDNYDAKSSARRRRRRVRTSDEFDDDY